FQGTKDPLVPHTQAYKLADAMTVKNVRGRVALYVGDGHGWEGIEKTLVEATDFLLENLKKSDQQEGRRRRF
ncbi:MAG: alpha/beta hydrolase family protein, partial [bacterium]